MKKDISKLKGYSILFCLSFSSFLLISLYVLLALVVIGDVSYISAILLLFTCISSIYLIIKYQALSNGLSTNIEKRNKIYNFNRVKQCNRKLKENNINNA